MPRRRREDRRAALRAEVARQLIAAVAALGEALRRSRDDAEARRLAADADVERAARAAPAVLAVTVVRRPDRARVGVLDVAAQTVTAHLFRHRSPRGLRRDDARAA